MLLPMQCDAGLRAALQAVAAPPPSLTAGMGAGHPCVYSNHATVSASAVSSLQSAVMCGRGCHAQSRQRVLHRSAYLFSFAAMQDWCHRQD